MPARQCFHCKQWIEPGDAHDCWTTTEAALTKDLSDDLRDAWDRLRETAAEFGQQRIYASHNSIMFARKSCYFFVRPKRKFLEVVVFLGRTLKAPQVRRAMPSSKTKMAHLIQVRHRDEVESPITDWLQEAYEFSETAGKAGTSQDSTSPAAKTAEKSARRSAQPKAARKTGTRRAAPKTVRGAARKTPAAASTARKTDRRRSAVTAK